MIKEIDEAYLQHSVELTALSAYTPKPSTSHLDTIHLEFVGSSLFTITVSMNLYSKCTKKYHFSCAQKTSLIAEKTANIFRSAIRLSRKMLQKSRSIH